MRTNKKKTGLSAIWITFFSAVLFSLVIFLMAFTLTKQSEEPEIQRLNQETLTDVTVNQNMNIVFYKKDCPYCNAAKTQVTEKSDNSPYPTFWIDLDTRDGQILKHKYSVKYASTIVSVRKGKAIKRSYAGYRNGSYYAKVKAIDEALRK